MVTCEEEKTEERKEMVSHRAFELSSVRKPGWRADGRRRKREVGDKSEGAVSLEASEGVFQMGRGRLSQMPLRRRLRWGPRSLH